MRLALLALLAALALAQNNPVTPLYPSSVDDTQLGVFADRAYSTLASVLESTDTTLTVVDGSRFPDAEFWVVVCPTNQCGVGASQANGETIFIAGKSGNVLTIGASGRQISAAQTGTSTGLTHGIGEAVVLAPGAGQMNRWLAELKELHDAVLGAGGGLSSGFGPYSALASVTGMVAGDAYLFDGSEDTLYTHAVYDGTDWVPFYKGYPCEPPVLGDFTWDNQGSATAVTTGGSVVVTMPNATASRLRVLYKSAPTAPYTIEILVLVHFFGDGVLRGGATPGPGPALMFRESSGGKLLGLAVFRKEPSIQRWSTSSSMFGADELGSQTIISAGPYWLRIENDGTNRLMSESYDGKRFRGLHAASPTYNAFLAPDQVGFGAHEYSGSHAAYYSFLSWKEF